MVSIRRLARYLAPLAGPWINRASWRGRMIESVRRGRQMRFRSAAIAAE